MLVKGFYGDNFYDIIDETMIFNRALSESEIQNIYNAQKPAGMAKAETKEVDLKGLASILSAIQDILEKFKSLF